MRAKYIKEYNFERGKETKAALDIGNKAYRIADDLGLLMSELRSLWHNLHNMVCSQNLSKKIFLWSINSEYDIINSEYDAMPEEDKDSSYFQDLTWAFDNKDDAWAVYELSKEEVYELYENIQSFERNKDPKEIMDLGIHKIIKTDEFWNVFADELSGIRQIYSIDFIDFTKTQCTSSITPSLEVKLELLGYPIPVHIEDLNLYFYWEKKIESIVDIFELEILNKEGERKKNQYIQIKDFEMFLDPIKLANFIKDLMYKHWKKVIK